MTNKKEKVSSLLTVEDVVRKLQWINTAIRQCNTGLRNGLRNPKESLGSLHQEKHRLILELLQSGN